MNPLLSIWGRPTETIHYVLAHKKLTYSLLILALAAVTTAPFSAMQFLFMEDFPIAGVLFIAYFGVLVSTAAGWFIGAGLYTWVGKWLGGKGTYKEMLAIIPLGSLPIVWALPFSVLLVICFIIIRLNDSAFAASFVVAAVFLGPLLMFVFIGLSIYGMVILSKGIGIVHRFSAWKGFGTIAIILGFFMVLYIIFMISLIMIIFPATT
ncbi:MULTISPECIES: Yip1 family protein [Sporosarcina]|uniref:Yip1 family protein n=1 Tax=Sporosarcina TaxID=1569 RepID=UPI00058C9943|nr:MULTISPECIES: Yip1 family protein [Sporosarcina]WJY27597.1 Yip1 family protein [Sporosarcina sp. 0.2-SM1T-5]